MIGVPSGRFSATTHFDQGETPPFTAPFRTHYISDMVLIGAGGFGDYAGSGGGGGGGGEVKVLTGGSLPAVGGTTYTVQVGVTEGPKETSIIVNGTTYEAKGGFDGGFDYLSAYTFTRGGDGGFGGAGGVVSTSGTRGVGGSGAVGGNSTPTTSGPWTSYPGGGGGAGGGGTGYAGGTGYQAGSAANGTLGGGGGGSLEDNHNTGLSGRGLVGEPTQTTGNDRGKIIVTWRS